MSYLVSGLLNAGTHIGLVWPEQLLQVTLDDTVVKPTPLRRNPAGVSGRQVLEVIGRREGHEASLGIFYPRLRPLVAEET